MNNHVPALNALKHGAFCNLGVLPGEDRSEFLKLHQCLIDEFKPAGTIEEDAVIDLAKCVWRKAHLGVCQHGAWASKKWGKYLADKNEPDFNFDLALLTHLRDQLRNWGADSPEHFELIKKEAEDSKKVMPAVEDVNKHMEPFAKAAGLDPEELLREEITDLLLALHGDVVTLDKLNQEIELAERLDRRIERILKRLMQLKAMKPMVGLGSGASTQQALPRRTTGAD
jgi:hypothetical protein